MRMQQADPYRGDTLHDRLFVRVFTAARMTIGAEWNTRDVCSGYWRLYINSRAGASLTLDSGQTHRLTPGALHLVPAWVRFSCRNTRPLDHRYVHFDVIGMAPETVQRLFPAPLALPLTPALRILARELHAQGAPEVVLCRAKAVIHAALADLFAGTATGASALLRDPGPVANAVRQIERNLGQRLTNRVLAAACHLSEDHFGRVFRARMGRTPAQYVIERRLAAASQELAFTRDSIEQIAERLGFANRFHLTRMFTRRMGIPPAAYRRQLPV